MKYLPLVLAGLWRKPTRTVFAFLSIMVAFILFGILSAIDAGFAHALETARLDRMYVGPRFGSPLPLSYLEKIAAVPGVTMVSPQAGLNGYFRDKRNPAGATMTDARYFAVRPELTITKQQIAALLRTRTGAIVGTGIARRYGWKVGDKIPLTTNTAAQNGNRVWTFDILGITENVDNEGEATVIIGNYKYLDEARVTDKGTANYYIVRIGEPARAAAIGSAIDKLFANSPAPTRTASEKSNAQSGLQSLGDVSVMTRAIVSAVLFMLLFLTGNTMMQSVRERVPEFAVLKTLGYSDMGVLALVFAESVVLCGLAGGLGLMLIKLVFPVIKHNAIQNVAGLLMLPWSALVTGFGCGLLVAFASGLFPALRVKRLNVVDALAGR